MHQRSIIYRDLKPDNVMIDKQGHIKIIDFGFAKKLNRGEMTCSLVGTPDYMAPEILSVEYYNKSVDYWALGEIYWN